MLTDHDRHATPPDEGIDDRHPMDFFEPEPEPEDAPLAVRDIGTVPVDAVRIFLAFILPTGDALKPTYWKTATARLASLSHAARIDGVAEHSLADLAAALGCSRALLSLHSVSLRDWSGIASHGGRSRQARAVYAERCRKVWHHRDTFGGTQDGDAGAGGTGVHESDSKPAKVAPMAKKRQPVKSERGTKESLASG